jgi:hypothetical protein
MSDETGSVGRRTNLQRRRFMATTRETDQVPNALVNGRAEIEHLVTLVRELQEECIRMGSPWPKRRWSAIVIAKSNWTRHVRHPRWDIPTLEAISAGPVEMIE